MATTRCKFMCNSVKKTVNPYRQPTKEGEAQSEFLFVAEFSAVYDGSPENKEFFQYTPTGKLELGVYKQDIFAPGKQYYLDFTEAEEAPKAVS